MTDRLVKKIMAPRTKAQFAQIRHNRKEAIAAAAMQLFANYGFESTSISQIAKAAGVSKGLLYNYFKSKDSLVKEIVLEGFHQIMESLDFKFDRELDRGTFIKLIDKNFEHLKNNADLWKLYTAVLTQPRVMELVKDELFAVVDPFIESVSLYFAKKGVKNPQAYDYFIGALLDGIGLDYLFAPENYPLEEIKEIIIEKII